MDIYPVRLVCLDSSMCSPIEGLDIMYSDFRGSSVNQVPILRLYGSTPTGEKICVHIHGVFPYIYIPYDGTQDANSLMYKIAASIDKAVNIYLKQASSQSQHVYKITLVSGIPMYGYHNKNHQFFKVYLYNPLLIRSVTSLLMNENTLGKMYQPHEAHLSFTLQFMIDYNLHGMSNMALSNIKFRQDPNRPNQNLDPGKHLPGTVLKMSICELEGDCQAEDILNRDEIASGNIAANPGIAALWADEQQRRRNKGEISQIEHVLELKRMNIEPTKSHFLYKNAINERLSVFSTDTKVVDQLNESVYPVETPDHGDIRNASMVDSQSSYSSLDETITTNDLDETIKPSQDYEANTTLDQDAMNLLKLLNELENAKDGPEEDSILTQVEQEEEEDNHLDLSMSLETIDTPKKIITIGEDEDKGIDDLCINKIPQLDGQSDGSFMVSENNFKNLNYIDIPMNTQKDEGKTKKIFLKKALYVKLVKCGRSMPDLNEIEDRITENMGNKYSGDFITKQKKAITCKKPIHFIMGDKRGQYVCRKRIKLTKKERLIRKVKEEITKLGNRINKINRQDQIFAIMKKLHEKENVLYMLLAKNNIPKFKVVPKIKVKGINTESIDRSLSIESPILKCSLDGTVDSSSSDDEKESKKRRRYDRKTRSCSFSKYEALPISIMKSPSKYPKEPAVTHQMSIKNTNTEDTPSIMKKNSSVCDINVKRQLFTDEICLHSTIFEENEACSYYPVTRVKNILENAEDASSSVFQNDIFNDSSDEAVSQSDSCLSNENNFQTDDNLNQSFFCSQALNLDLLTTAEKYDKETNYHAREGSSKVLTPMDSNVLSQDTQVLHSSSENSNIGLTAPNQQSIKLNDIPGGNDNNCIPSSSGIFPLSEIHNSVIGPEVILAPKKNAPSRKNVIDSLEAYNIPLVEQQVPFYSNVADAIGTIEVGYNVLKVNSKSSIHLPEFESQTDSLNLLRKRILENVSSEMNWKKSNIKNVILSFCKERECIIEPVEKPPTAKMVFDWITEKNKIVANKPVEKVEIHLPLNLGAGNDESDMDLSLTLTPCTPKTNESIIAHTPNSSSTSGECSSSTHENMCREKKKTLLKTTDKCLTASQDSSINHSCQITGVSVHNSFNRSAQNLQDARAIIEHHHLTVFVMELHIRTRGELRPDPSHDSIRAVFYSIFHDVPEPKTKPTNCSGIIAINNLPLSVHTMPILNGAGTDCDVAYVDSEENLITELLKLITYWDPDILTGYEVELLSWGYVIERANVLGINLKSLLGRTKINGLRWKDEDAPNELKIVGRIVLDVWRLMKHEIALQSYTFESVMSRILKRRVPHYPYKDLSFWWDHRTNLYRHRTVKYYLTRVNGVLELFNKLDFLGRTSELARLFGIQFYEVLSRGTQFRVESMMLRLAKPLNFIPVSPSIQQRAKMKAPEYIALVLEPESKLYNDPVIVLDFQSLYPSIIIAYNYCFTTCIGRVESLGRNGPFEFGATQLKMPRKRLQKLVERDLLNFAPCGVGFVKKEVRDGIMPRMLREILDTRLMVKNAMKENKDDKVLQKVLHSRQLGLKLIANVTYGYTAANFSGRMPSVEVGDSVVSKGRETLQRAIEMVESTPEWGARVVYGDTDSLFVMVPGRSREHAFRIGKKIAEAVTNANPDPIKLKLEKVYQPCILQTKKRYVGYMYESPDQKEPVYEAKGIETVRRDGCPAVSKMLEKCLRILFETKDVSIVKKYVMRQFDKILSGRANIQDLIFAKEYRGAAGYRPGACVPALELTRKWTAVDKRNEPRSGERVPYIIVNGPPGLPLIRLVRSPWDLLQNPSLKPNALYYITRVIIPPINRCFNLIGADLNSWFNQMPRKVSQNLTGSVSPKIKSTISQYFMTNSCAACGDQTQTGICQNCCCDSQKTTIILTEKMRMWETNHQNIILVCQTCTSTLTEIKCVSLDCPVLYRRVQTDRDAQQIPYVRELLLSSNLLT